MSKNILVTGIGGNVGQGILRNILKLNMDIKIIGTDMRLISAGNHLCDRVYQVPFSASTEYIPNILRICNKEKINLIIPSTDLETYYLALVRKKLPALACSDAKTAKIFLNKYETWINFKKFSIPFAPTFLSSEYNGEFDNVIVKPKEGVGSKNIYINPPTPKDFSDEFIIQQLIKGKEITTAFYVTKDKKLLGQITFLRALMSGTTTICEVTFEYDNKVEKLIRKITNKFDIRGSCNIQSSINNKGEIIPFELNCRISGTNSIRSQFGFEDVRYTIEEYLLNKKPQRPIIKKGSAVRILMDVIYPDIGLNRIKDKTTKHYIF